MTYNPKDYYFKKAKEENFAARSVFKLQEINDRFHILKSGDKVVDLGASPGSWSQYIAQSIGKGKLLGIDLTPIHLQLPNTVFITADIYQIDWQQVFQETNIAPPFNVVVSDMAPKTSGIKVTDHARSIDLCLAALEFAKNNLFKGGNFVCKLFDGEDTNSFKLNAQTYFQKLSILRPQSTRKESKEIFIICMGFKGVEKTATT